MKHIEILNDEDSRIWAALETFDFDGFKTDSELRVALYTKISEVIGRCQGCSSFNRRTSWCKLLSQFTGCSDRCSDFDPRESEDAAAFDVMVEPFVEEQKRAADAVKINKYTHWSTKQGPGKPKETQYKQDNYDGHNRHEKHEDEET